MLHCNRQALPCLISDVFMSPVTYFPTGGIARLPVLRAVRIQTTLRRAHRHHVSEPIATLNAHSSPPGPIHASDRGCHYAAYVPPAAALLRFENSSSRRS